MPMTGKDTKQKGGSKRLEGVLTLDLLSLETGAKLKLVGNRIAEVVDNPRDGMWILLRYLVAPDDPAVIGQQELIFWADILAVVE